MRRVKITWENVGKGGKTWFLVTRLRLARACQEPEEKVSDKVSDKVVRTRLCPTSALTALWRDESARHPPSQAMEDWGGGWHLGCLSRDVVTNQCLQGLSDFEPVT